MGFWEGMRRMVKGEPVFQTGDSASQSAMQEDHFAKHPQPPSNGDVDVTRTPVDNHGEKIIPQFVMDRVDSNVSGDHLDVWVTFNNTSSTPLRLDKTHMFGQTTDLNYQLEPGVVKQIRVYSGNVLRNDAYTHAEVDYRSTLSGDYFQARYIVEFDYEQDGTYTPNDFNLQYPIKDI